MIVEDSNIPFHWAGVFFTEGPLWHEQRRFALRNLRDFGFGRRQDELESDVNDEILNLIDFIKNGPKYGFEKVYKKWSALSNTLFLIIMIFIIPQLELS